MSGIWLFLWIMWMFFFFGVGVGRWLERSQKTLGKRPVKLSLVAFLNPFVFIVPAVVLNTVEQVVKAGWIPKTAAIRQFLWIGDGVCGIIAVVYLALAIAYIIKNRMNGRQKSGAAHSETL